MSALVRLVMLLGVIGAGQPSTPGETRGAIALTDYSVWSADIIGGKVVGTLFSLATPNDRISFKGTLSVPIPFDAACNWGICAWNHYFGRMPKSIQVGPRNLLPKRRDHMNDVPEEGVWRLFCDSSSDGRYAIACTGLWPTGSVFRLVDLASYKVISEQMLPGTTPVSFSGFVRARDVLGYCATEEGDEISRESVELNGAVNDLSQLGKVFAVPKCGDWYAIDKIKADFLLASPDGTRVLIRNCEKGNRWCVEVRTADLNKSLWATKITWDEQDLKEGVGIPSMVWSTDGKLICWRLAVISPLGKNAVLYCIDAHNGRVVARVRSTREVLGKCLIVIAPHGEERIVKRCMGLATMDVGRLRTRPSR